MQAKKGVANRYATLLARDVLPVQTAHIRTSFELAPASRLAEAAASLASQAIQAWEQTRGTCSTWRREKCCLSRKAAK